MTAGSHDTAAAVVVGVASGACFAVSTVLQARAARRVPQDQALSPRLLVSLLAQPLWRWGMVTAVFSYALQALALSLGPIALVQPLVVTDLLFALPLGARLAGRQLGWSERGGALLVVAGLATFLTIAHPSAGITSPPLSQWFLVVLAVAVLTVAALVLAGGAPGVRRSSLLAVAAGLSLGLLSAFTKTVTGLFAQRGIHALASWPPYALAATGVVALVLSQSALQSGPLLVTLPLLDVLEPLSSVLIAATVFAEHLDTTTAALALEALAAALVAVGVVMLDHSPLLRAAQEGAAVPAPRPAGPAGVHCPARP